MSFGEHKREWKRLIAFCDRVILKVCQKHKNIHKYKWTQSKRPSRLVIDDRIIINPNHFIGRQDAHIRTLAIRLVEKRSLVGTVTY